MKNSTESKKREIFPQYPGQTLHLGCGNKILDGCFNCDRVPLPGVNEVVNLDHYPWPFASGAWDKVVAHHVLEHLLDLTSALSEIARILKPGGTCELKVPHIAGWGCWNDPTHRNFFTRRSFQYFQRNEHWNYYFDFSFTQVKAKSCFGIGRSARLNLLMNPLVNTILYDYWLWKIIPCAEIQVLLVK
jgi:SAM-dependent methyltransferase